MLGGELQVAFALQNMIRDLHISKFQMRSLNSKKIIYFIIYNLYNILASFKKKQKQKQKQKIKKKF